LEAQSDKDMGEDDDETSKSDDDNGEDSFVQVKKNIDDDNAEAAEMARLEAQSDKDMGEDDDETSKSDDDNGEDSFVQVKKNIDDDNAEAAEMARLEAQSDKDMGEDDDETSKSDDDDGEESFVQVKPNIDDDNAKAAKMAAAMDRSKRHGVAALSNPQVVAQAARAGVKTPFLHRTDEVEPVVAVESSAVAGVAERIMNGLGNNDLDNDLMDSADEDLADLQNMKEADEAKLTHRTALTSHTVQVHETTAQRASRYFALHGMSKVGLMLGDELSTAQTAKIQKEAEAAKSELASEDENDSGKTNQWKAVDALRRRSLSSA